METTLYTLSTERKVKNELDTYKKEYVYHTGYYESQDKQYGFPYIDFIKLGTLYDTGFYYSSHSNFTMEFQVTLREDNGQPCTDRKTYGGSIENLRFENIQDLAKIDKVIDNQIKRLELRGDIYHTIITALRAAGYRKVIKQENHIVGLE